MFSSLRIRNYRLFAMGQAVSNTGTWMQRIAQDWLVLSLTGSATAVGITTALSSCRCCSSASTAASSPTAATSAVCC